MNKITIITAVLFVAVVAALAFASLRDAAHFTHLKQVIIPAAKVISVVEASGKPHLKAYRDGNRYSIGYGTKASGPNQTITLEQAINERNKHIIYLDKRFQKSYIYKAMTPDDKVRIIVFAYQRGYSRGLAVVNATVNPRSKTVVAMIKSWGYHNRVNKVEKMIS